MGMNFYAHYNMCKCCDRFDVLHIGKSSAGWSFSFRGYIPNEWGEEPEINIEKEEDWRDFLNRDSVKIVNEEDEEISLEDFWQRVEDKRDGKNHTTYCRNDKSGWNVEHGKKDCWLDEHGNSFSGTEFS